MDTNSPSAQIATASETETTVRRIATNPNGYSHMTMNRMYPSQIGIRASLPLQSWPSVAGLMERALMFQYATRKTQQARIEIPVSIACVLSPQDAIATRQGRHASSVATGGLHFQWNPVTTAALRRRFDPHGRQFSPRFRKGY
jgi:hypothetical protein